MTVTVSGMPSLSKSALKLVTATAAAEVGTARPKMAVNKIRIVRKSRPVDRRRKPVRGI